MPRLEAVVEYSISFPDEGSIYPWKLSPVLIRLWQGISDGELGLILTELITYNRIETEGDAPQFFQRIINSDCLIIPGGIRAIDDKGKLVNPSCCCGLEIWREWLEYLEGGASPWLGHSPSPEIEQIQNGYRVWSASEEEDKNLRYHIYFSEEEFVQNLQQVCSDLKIFLSRLREWANNLSPENAEAVVNKIDVCFEITAPQ